MRMVVSLVFAHLRQHPARLILTSLAVIAAACVVVWVVSGYDALLGQFDEFGADYLGRYDVMVVPEAKKAAWSGSYDPPAVPEALIDALRADPAVAAVEPVSQWRVEITKEDGGRRPGRDTEQANNPGPHQGSPGLGGGSPGFAPGSPENKGSGGPGTGQDSPGIRGRRPGRGPGGPGLAGQGGGPGPFRPRPTLVGTNAGQPPYPLLKGRWIDPDQPGRLEGVLSSGAAEGLKIELGDEVSVRGEEKTFRLKIVGLVQEVGANRSGGAPTRMPFGFMRGPAMSALYVLEGLAEKITGKPRRAHCVQIAMADKAAAGGFCDKWAARIAQKKLPVSILAVTDVGTELKEGFSTAQMRSQAYAATGISLLAALFIILTTLSMGVHQRTRQFAVLRAVGLTKTHVAAMIFLEGLVLAVIGWLGGLAAGWGLLLISSLAQPGLFARGAALGPRALLLSGACAFGGALAAAVLPAWKCTRIRPLDAMTPQPLVRPTRLSLFAVALGLLLIAVNPLIVFIIPMSNETRYLAYALVGCTTMAVGFILAAPLVVLAAERFLGPLVARMLLLERHLLNTQLSSNLSRTLGTTIALTLGLGLFVAMQTWGYTMLGPFVPGDWVPEALVAFPSGGIPDGQTDEIAHLPGVIPEQCLPLAVEQPKMAADLTGSRERESVTRQDNVVLIGLEPRAGLLGPNAVLKLDFVAGNAEDAVKQLEEGHGCIVPDHFARTTGLGLGDRLPLIPPEAAEKLGAAAKPVEYTIAGVVSLPGWHWMTKFSGVRRRSGRSAAMVFASREDVRRDFDLKQTSFFWLNLDESGDVDALGKALEPIALRHQQRKKPVNTQGMMPFRTRVDGGLVRITTADFIRQRIGARADGWIWAMCELPLVTLLIASLGVVNAVMASVRARQWEMGVLRAVGLTRFALVRLILAEALLIALVACGLSLGFGVMAGWCGAGMSQYVDFFGGLEPTLVIPWSKIVPGLAAALALCLAAALWPAIWAGLTQPWRLLQAGRAAM